ncbi:MAG: hypothetical protein LUE27_01900 [Clostridia bacterium]|nr:hypothetical protein [Clostridia bacterium]
MKMIFTKRTDDEKRREDERLEAFKEWLHGELTEQRTKLVRGVAAVLSDRFARTEPDPQPKEADETRQVEEQEITPDLFAQLEPVEPIEEEAVEVETKDAKGRVNWRAYGIKNGNVKAGVAARLESLCDGDTSFLYGHKALD